LKAYVVRGGEKLSGSIKIEGAKNAILPILAASLINGDKNVLYNCPDLKDVSITLNILELIGCAINKDSDKITIDTSSLSTNVIPDRLVREMRSSVIMLGAMLTRHGKVILSYPGGCEIGMRPIDIHVRGLRALGAKITEAGGYLICEADKIIGTEINLDFPSVGATENIILASVSCEGTAHIRNAAREPEIVDLQNYLNAIGCKISGAGTNIIKIEGVKKFKPVEYTVMPDRIVAGTYLIAAAATYGNIEITDVVPDHLSSVISKLEEMGCKIKIQKDKVEILAPKKLKSVDSIKTQPYPGFPTDLQAQFLALTTLAAGTSVITENIFENRFKQVGELVRMGAKITIEGRTAVVKGVKNLYGAAVEAKDLRGGAALIIAGLAAEGESTIYNVNHIDRGYEKIEKKLASLGANIEKKSI
jgi:UDP-N-acetylglucosamine 1-carboxyvinyltransferase